jgi:hypothetical protein
VRTAATFPFRDIVTDRPYPPTGLTTARWAAEVKPVVVRLETLILTQDGVRIGPLFGVLDRESDAFPHAVDHHGQLYLEDGHHRVVRAALRDRIRTMWMRVFTAEHT